MTYDTTDQSALDQKGKRPLEMRRRKSWSHANQSSKINALTCMNGYFGLGYVITFIVSDTSTCPQTTLRFKIPC